MAGRCPSEPDPVYSPSLIFPTCSSSSAAPSSLSSRGRCVSFISLEGSSLILTWPALPHHTDLSTNVISWQTLSAVSTYLISSEHIWQKSTCLLFLLFFCFRRTVYYLSLSRGLQRPCLPCCIPHCCSPSAKNKVCQWVDVLEIHAVQVAEESWGENDTPDLTCHSPSIVNAVAWPAVATPTPLGLTRASQVSYQLYTESQ